MAKRDNRSSALAMAGRRLDGLWEDQFDVSLDYARTPVTKSYVICTSPRSGSHFLGHLLHAAGGFGYPLEYVQKANFAVWSQRAREAGVSNALDYVKSIRTDVNGVFGIKVHFRHLPTFVKSEPEILQYRFITLERRDLLKQAVSYCWAAQTKSWISGMEAVAPAKYDWDMIAEKLRVIAESNAGWRAFICSLGVASCNLIFEDVRADPGAAVRRIAEFVGVSPHQISSAGGFFPTEQADPEKDEWVRRFVGDARERLTRGTLVRERPQDRRRSFATIRALLGRLGFRENGKGGTFN